MTTAFEAMSFRDADPGRRTLGAAVLAAIALHTAAAVAMKSESAPHDRWKGPPTQIELESPPPPEKEDAPEPPKEEEPAETPKPEAPAIVAPKAAAPAPAPAAARAGNIVAASETAQPSTDEEPVSFVTDPFGTSYGSGVVARGGTADVGAPGAKVGGAPRAPVGGSGAKPGGGEVLVPAADLSRAPRLSTPDACKGYFPGAADADEAVVSVVAVVKANGAVSSVAIASESPRDQGFGKAARECLLAHRFVPALGRSGEEVATSTTVKVRFAR